MAPCRRVRVRVCVCVCVYVCLEQALAYWGVDLRDLDLSLVSPKEDLNAYLGDSQDLRICHGHSH